MSRRLAADGDRRRAACACARAERAIVARSGRCAGGRRDRLRQRRDRPFSPRQSAPARLERARRCPTCMRGLRTPGLSTPTPRSSACATSSQVRSTTSILKLCSTSDRASPRWRSGSGEDEDLRQLPAKFSFVLDAQGRLPLGDVDADIRFEASRDGDVRGVSRRRRCAGCAMRAGRDGRCRGAARPCVSRPCRRWRSGAAADARAGRADRRFGRVCGGALRDEAERAFATARCRYATSSARTHSARRSSSARRRPFGEIEAVRFKALIERARALGASSLRLTPWRAFLIAGLDRRGAESLVDSMAELGFIVDADDPRLRIAACPGAPACMHGHRSVRDDATRWAAILPKGDGVILHVSGCAKGCARPAATAATFTATATGYDLILGGRAGDPPTRRGLSSARGRAAPRR